MIEWYRRWRKIGYRELWHLHYGGANEGDKGCYREYVFLAEVAGSWRSAYAIERTLLQEAEKLLTANGIEPPTEKRRRELQERIAEWREREEL